MDILYIDNHLLVADKPAGLATQPTEHGVDNFEDLGKLWLKSHANKPGNVFLCAAHRLDKPVSGVVVFAKTSKALSRLHTFFRERRVQKKYRAWVEGALPNDKGSLQHHLVHDHHFARISSTGDSQAKLCRLDYVVVERTSAYTVVEIDLLTGRYHQIRAQFAAIGHPVVGDLRYKSTQPYAPHAIALLHYEMSIPHPISREVMTFHSKISLGRHC